MNLPEGLQPLVRALVDAHGDFSAAAETLATDPSDASLHAAYMDAEQARLESVETLFVAVGLPPPGQDADAVGDQELYGPSPSPSAGLNTQRA